MYIIKQDEGITIVAPAKGPNDMVSRNEEVLVDARRKYYEKVSRNTKNKKRLQFGEYTGKEYLYTILLISSRQSIIYIITF